MRTTQNEAKHCQVLVTKIDRGDREAARELILFYPKNKQESIAKKYKKDTWRSFLEMANFLAGKAAKRD